MKHKFNQQAAIWTFCAALIVFVIAVGVSRIQYDQSPNLIGSLVYGILALFAALITGLLVPKKKRKHVDTKWIDEEIKKEDEKNDK